MDVDQFSILFKDYTKDVPEVAGLFRLSKDFKFERNGISALCTTRVVKRYSLQSHIFGIGYVFLYPDLQIISTIKMKNDECFTMINSLTAHNQNPQTQRQSLYDMLEEYTENLEEHLIDELKNIKVIT